ncbi:hypothetical protein MMC25_005042 [Agyrium rufum]|nr:hypothetical protein [Agyrium rufum]
MADSTPKSYHSDPTLYLYTSLTAGSSQIITATSRLEGILKANKVPFRALDVATDEKARMLWGRRAGKRKLPGLVRMGMIVGDSTEVEEWNEFGEVKQNVGDLDSGAGGAGTGAGASSTPTSSTTNTPSRSSSGAGNLLSSLETPKKDQPAAETPLTIAMRQASAAAAKKANEPKSQRTQPTATKISFSDDVSKLDNSGPTGMPPPSGTTEAAGAMKPETGAANVQSKADQVPLVQNLSESDLLSMSGELPKASSTTTTTAAKPDAVTSSATTAPLAVPEQDLLSSSPALDSSTTLASLQAPLSPDAVTTTHRGSNVSEAPEEVIKEVEKSTAIAEDPEAEEKADATPAVAAAGATTALGGISSDEGVEASKVESEKVTTEEATTSKELEEHLPGTVKTQDQDAADASKAGDSVGD